MSEIPTILSHEGGARQKMERPSLVPIMRILTELAYLQT